MQYNLFPAREPQSNTIIIINIASSNYSMPCDRKLIKKIDFIEDHCIQLSWQVFLFLNFLLFFSPEWWEPCALHNESHHHSL